MHDIKPASYHGMSPMRLRSLESNTSWCKDVGESCAKDEHGKTIVRHAYAYDKGDPDKPPFYLIAMATLVDERNRATASHETLPSEGNQTSQENAKGQPV
jgi:hypothetical protein